MANQFLTTKQKKLLNRNLFNKLYIIYLPLHHKKEMNSKRLKREVHI